MAGPGADLRQRLAGPYVALVALHSLAVGVVLALFPRWSAAFGGFDPAQAGFFTRQGGVFHLVLGAAYALEWRLSRSLRLMVLAKAAGTLFLVATLLGGGAAWSVALSAAGDAAMLGLALALAPRPAARAAG